ncbi:VanZ family protein [Oryzihumus sp.]|jgi:glycopeptide antibiotics resistance protein|uniref:VanZ family protein n=1 Tax=Oryzihumus sp. TaxID=1968903 RepID=UPI002ED7B6F0
MHILGYRVPALLPPGMLVALLLALVVYLVVRRRGHSSRAWLSALLTAWTGMVLLATLAPQRLGAIQIARHGRRYCAVLPHLSPWGALQDDQRLLNVLLFIPLGALVFVFHRHAAVRVAAMVVVLPIVIETVQYVVVSLHRACDGTDVVDNWMGLAIGLVIGLAVAVPVWAVRKLRRQLRARVNAA